MSTARRRKWLRLDTHAQAHGQSENILPPALSLQTGRKPNEPHARRHCTVFATSRAAQCHIFMDVTISALSLLLDDVVVAVATQGCSPKKEVGDA